MENNGNMCVLKAAEALSRDIGKAIVRIDTSSMIKLGVSIGDIIEVKGKSCAVARVMPVHDESKGKNLIQMDGILRENASVALDENVSIRSIEVTEAVSITLAGRSGKQIVHNNDDLKHVRQVLQGIPVVKGNNLRIKLLGYSYEDYEVVETIPEGAVVIHPSTVIRIKREGAVKKDNRVSYEDIGGLGKQVQRIREMIELPLRYPEVFNRLGIQAPKGVLLFGPPGTGKTLIARAVANETDAHFIHVNGPEIINKYYGESEAKLREIFDKASSSAPSIIFLDEIDAISPKREDVKGDVEKRVVAQLLALMDGLEDRGQVIVIGATNIPNALDPALRRPGRFDREIEIGIPDKNGRLKILQIHTRDMPLEEDVDLLELSNVTHGFVGADLQALCREAAMTALRKFFPDIDFSTSSIPYDKLSNLKVTMDDFNYSLHEIEPSAIREIFVDIPDVTFDDIGGLKEIKETIIKNIVWPDKYTEIYKLFGCKSPKGILFYGAPGTGKTMLAKAIASLNNANFISVKGPELLSKWVGESEKSLREIFKKARQASPCIIFFDEIDSLLPVRGKGADSSTTERLICQMLTEMDGLEELKGVLVIGATNRLDMLDPALLRPGRFGLALEFKKPGFNEREEIFRIHLSDIPTGDDINIEELALLTEGLTGAEIMELCQQAAMNALTEYISLLEEENSESGSTFINYRHFENILKSR